MLLVKRYLSTLHCLAASIIFTENINVGIKKLAGFSIVIFGEPFTPIKLKTISLLEQTSKQLSSILKSEFINFIESSISEGLSRETTVKLAPNFFNFFIKGLPINPVPPVTRTFLFL